MGEGGALTIVMARHLDDRAECESVEERGVWMSSRDREQRRGPRLRKSWRGGISRGLPISATLLNSGITTFSRVKCSDRIKAHQFTAMCTCSIQV